MPGDDESKAVLDAFFLGKALAEALTERAESVVGEVFSVVGQWQAEQQKQVQEFQVLHTAALALLLMGSIRDILVFSFTFNLATGQPDMFLGQLIADRPVNSQCQLSKFLYLWISNN